MGVESLRGVTTTPFVALAPCVSGESILGPTDVVGRSRPPVWHQVIYVSEVSDNSVLTLGLFVMVKSDAVFGLLIVSVMIKSDAALGLLIPFELSVECSTLLPTGAEHSTSSLLTTSIESAHPFLVHGDSGPPFRVGELGL